MLARTHEGKPGLPRGRSHLPPPAVSASQRERLLRSVIAAVSEHGYQAVSVAEKLFKSPATLIGPDANGNYALGRELLGGYYPGTTTPGRYCRARLTTSTRSCSG